jgi:hypothetical protein
VFRPLLQPDRMAILELSLRGEILVVPEVLRLRRVTSSFSLERQRATLFEPGKRPPWAALPWWLVQATSLLATYAVRRPKGVGLIAIASLSLDIVAWQAERAMRRMLKSTGKSLKPQLKRFNRWRERQALSRVRDR